MIEHEPNRLVESREHYPYVTRSLVRLFNEGKLTNVRDVVVEPRYGYVSQIQYSDDSFRITYGNDLGLNTGSSEDLAKDKGYTKFMLRTMGVDCPEGDEFLLPWWAEEIKKSPRQQSNADIHSSDAAHEYIETTLHYPVYVKPVAGSKGGDVYRVESEEELAEILALYDEKKVRVAVIEKAIDLPDYRIVVLDGELISAYQRVPLKVVGDGVQTTEGLITSLQDQYFAEGRDTKLNAHDQRIATHLGKRGLGIGYIPSTGEEVTLMPISNLSAGGTSLDVTSEISPHWVELAAGIAKKFNLRLCGVDLACGDVTSPLAPYSVLEVNSSPGLDHYASSGEAQRRIVDDLYVKVLNKPNAPL